MIREISAFFVTVLRLERWETFPKDVQQVLKNFLVFSFEVYFYVFFGVLKI